MRIAQLQLLKYGHFDGTCIELPERDIDFHIIYGDNEAGKSTSLAALDNLLFGFSKSTDYDFRFKMHTLRIGAVLTHADQQFEFQRRKGIKDTIIDHNGQAIANGEGQLAAMLLGMDQGSFKRLFLLNQSRLSQGAEELLTAGNDAGEALLASGAGLLGLKQVLQGYDVAADGLWGKTKKKDRDFFQAHSRLQDAQAAQRAAVVNASTYKAKKQALQAAELAFEEAAGASHEQQARQKKLERIRRVYWDVGQLRAVAAEIESLKGVPELAPAAADQLDEAERELQRVADLHERIERDLAKDQIERDAVTQNEQQNQVLRQRSADIEQLRDARVGVLAARDNLPRLQDVVSKLDNSVVRLSQSLGWVLEQGATLPSLLPSLPTVAKSRQLATIAGQVIAKLEAEQNNVAKAQRRVDQLQAQRPAVISADLTAFYASYNAAQNGKADVGARESNERARDRAGASVQSLFEAMQPRVADIEQLQALAVPTADVIARHRDAVFALENKTTETEEALGRERRQLESTQRQLDSHKQLINVPTDADIQALRDQRDSAWAVLVNRYLESKPVSDQLWESHFGDDANGRLVFEALLSQGDAATDLRFASADDAARHNGWLEQLAAGSNQISLLESELSASASKRQDLRRFWDALWAASGIQPGTPDQMLTWLQFREQCLEKQREVADVSIEIEQQHAKEAQLMSALVEQIKALSTTATLPEPLLFDQVMAHADQTAEVIKRDLDLAERHETSLRSALAELEATQASLTAAQNTHTQWFAQWQGVVVELGLEASTQPEAMESYLGVIEELRKNVDEIESVRINGIASAENEIQVFGKRTQALAQKIAEDIASQPADALVLELVRRLQVAQDQHKKTQQLDAQIEGKKLDLAALDEQQRAADAVVSELHRQAQTSEMGQLKKVIAQSANLQRLQLQRTELLGRLEHDGDGYSIDVLTQETADVDLDALRTELDLLEQEIKTHGDRVMPLRDTAVDARREFDAIGSSGDAAIAASQIQASYADMENIAANFIRARTAERLLSWGIEHFRKQKLGPLLHTASELFNTVTGGRYQRLVVEYVGDTPALAGVDADGVIKGTSAMSDGTRDQLYLALRLAAIQDYVQRSAPMPFVADDIFVNFDETRSAHAMRALCELSKSCQVILFTHHSHVVDIARSVVGADASMVSLS